MNRWARPVASAPHVIADLPPWCGGVLYDSDDDAITLVAKVPASEHAYEHVARLEMSPDHAHALVEALGRCLSRSRQNAQILEIPADESTD